MSHAEIELVTPIPCFFPTLCETALEIVNNAPSIERVKFTFNECTFKVTRESTMESLDADYVAKLNDHSRRPRSPHIRIHTPLKPGDSFT